MLLLGSLALAAAACSGVLAAAPFDGGFHAQPRYGFPALQYRYEALEPHMPAESLRVHHVGHHKAYTDKLNKVLGEWADEDAQAARKYSVVEMLTDLEGTVPDAYREDVRRFGGGYFNHALYFYGMSPLRGVRTTREPAGEIAKYMGAVWRDLDAFKTEFTDAAMSVFGSGYVWLVVDGATGRMAVRTNMGQDSPLGTGEWPVLCLDMWEHAYYLRYLYRKKTAIDAWWPLVDWENADKVLLHWVAEGLVVSSDTEAAAPAGEHEDL